MRAGRPSASAAVALGRGMAAVLSLALRPAPPASAAGFDDLDRLVPLLVNAGAAGLAWRTIKDTPARSHPAVAPLRELFEWQLLRSRIADTELATLAQKAGDAGVEPLLGKGWAVARLYPEIGLRTFGDFDIYLDPADHQRLVQVLKAWTGPRTYDVDVHRGASYLDDRPLGLLRARSALVPIGLTGIRVLSPEDLLRLGCLHLLAEGAIRAVWLCDIAVMLQQAGPAFDWDYFMSGDPLRTEWACAAIGLAHHLLDVDVSAAPRHRLTASPPAWLVRSVLGTWGAGIRSKGNRNPFSASGTSGMGVLRSLVERWPRPVEATIGVRGRMNAAPRWPYQIAEAMRRTVGFLRGRP